MSNFYTDNESLKFHLEHPLMEKIVRLKEDNFIEKELFDFAPLDYEDAIDSYNKVLEIVGEIAGDTIAPNAESVDHEGPTLVNNVVQYARGTQENHDTLVKAGLVGMSLPRKYDGLNFPMVPYVMAAEIVSRADAGFANIWGLQDCAETIHEFASEELQAEFLPMFNKGATAAMDLTEPDAGRLRLLCRASGVLVGAGCESFSDALSDVWTVAARYGAGYLPPESIDALVAALTDEMARAAAEISDTIEAEAAHV